MSETGYIGGTLAPFLAGSDADVRAFLQAAVSGERPAVRRRSFAKGQLIAHEGDESGDVWFILDGQVQVFRTTPSGRLVVLATLRGGDFAGEMAMIEAKERSACILALGPVEALVIPAALFRTWLAKEIVILHALLVQFSRRLRETNEQAVEIAGATVAQRLASQLLRQGRRTDEGTIVLAPCPKVTDLARTVNATREAVSKTLNGWIARGLVARDGGVLTVTALPELMAA